MPRAVRTTLVFGVIVCAGGLAAPSMRARQAATSGVAPTNDLPNPYETIDHWGALPNGRTWGSTSAVDIDPDGESVWVAERCGANSCWDAASGRMSPLDVVMEFDASGRLVRSFGAGMFVFPHGIHVDREGNVWVTDGRDNLPRRARGAPPDAPLPAPPARIVGHQVIKFSPEGRVLLVLGKPGGNQPGQPDDPGSFYQPNDVITSAAGDIFVAEGHGGANARIVKFDRTGKFIKAWGTHGSAPGEMDQPHGLAFDSQGRLFVADRSNNRLQIFDQDGRLLDAGWEQYSRVSGIWIDGNDMLYCADSESGSVARDRTNWTRGIRIGSIRDGRNGAIRYLIPDPDTAATNTSAAEGVAVDRAGRIYGAEVGPRDLKRYVRRGGPGGGL